MADNKQIQLRQIKTPLKLMKGIVTDTAPVNQPEGTYRYALNMIVESETGEIGSLINEEGNEYYINLPEDDLRIVGSVLINNNDIIIFSSNRDGTYNEIGIMSDRESYITIVKSSCLNFNWFNPIKAIYRILNGCERVVYFTDNFNKFKVINLDNLVQYTNIDANTNMPFSVEDANILDEWDCNKLNYSRDMVIPILDVLPAEDGGELKIGTYAFSIRYLDDDFNATDWLYITDTTAVVNITESTRPAAGLGFADGGVFDIVVNNLTNSNKLIRVNIANLDPTYPYVQLAVVQWVRGNDYEQEVYIIDEILPINRQNTITYTYTGNPNVLLQTTIDELSINNVKINTVKTIGQLDNRLYLGNSTDQQVNWSEFQRSASKTVINPIWKANNKTPVRGPSSHFYYFNERSYMRDEIYAFGIVYVFKDGTESPVFHIPGRPKNQGACTDSNGNLVLFNNLDLINYGNDNTTGVTSKGYVNNANRNAVPTNLNWDDQILSVTNNDNDTEVSQHNVKHIPLLEFQNTNEIERWKVYNTGIALPNSFNFSKGGSNYQQGIFSYYEGDQVYLPLNDCSGVDIWGEDAWGNPLVNTPIRHHKFPSGDISKPFDEGETGFIYPIGIQLSNVEIPSGYSNIAGYYVVRVDRKETDETVVDKGYVGFTRQVFPVGLPSAVEVFWYDTNTWPTGPPYASTNGNYQFVSPKTQFNTKLKTTDYTSFETIVEANYSDINISNPSDEKRKRSNGNFRGQLSAERLRKNLGYVYMNTPLNPTPPPNSTDYYVNQAAISPFNEALVCNRINRSSYVFKVQDELGNPDLIGGSQVPKLYYASKKRWRKPYSSIYNIEYKKIGVRLETQTGPVRNTLIFSGDIFISELTYRNMLTGLAFFPPDVEYSKMLCVGMFCESTINSQLRCHGIQPWETHFRHSEKISMDIQDFLDIDEYPDNPDFSHSMDYFRYHDHFSVDNTGRFYFSLPINFDYCLECQNKFPTRVWYSEKSNLEQRSDKYRIIRGNYYQDLPSDHGEVTGLFVTRNSLYANLEFASYVLPTQPQELNTNAGTVFVGTGEVFGTPPQMLETAERGYAGSQSQFSTVVTEFGALFIDANAGKVFKLTDKLEDLTALGIRNWFQRNGDFKINRQVKEFKNFSHIHPCGVNYHVGFDPRHNRVLITKKDYGLYDSFMDELENTNGFVEGTNIGFNVPDQVFYTWPNGGALEELKCTNELFFEDLSWTISLELSSNRWLSYHSYRPYIYMNNRNHYFTADEFTELNTPNKVWKHGSFNYGEFYDVTRQSIIEFIFNTNQMQTKTSEAIMYLSEVIDPNTGVEQYYDTFNEACLYNSWQTTGMLEVVPKNSDDPFANVFNNVGEIYADFNERRWSINEYGDYVTNRNEPLFFNNYLDPVYNSRRKIDGVLKFPNNEAYDFDKSPFEVEPLRDTWLGVWLAYNNTYGHKMVTEVLISNNNISFK